MAKKDEDKVIPMYAPWTIIQGGKADDDVSVEEVPDFEADNLIYIVASPTGLCGAFTKPDLVENYIKDHPNVQVFQVPKDIPVM